ncbi:MAG: lipoyl(octanoyl) transferase LipB [Bdellovibrionales bacterium]|nr:lipoyl(octanoyl) transferase LipB [Bdellovibrionales bacterium]
MEISDWGFIDYREALARQEDWVQKIANGEMDDQLVFCSHPPVVTLGRSLQAREDLAGWTGDVVEISRGGRATYHGPGQILIYPLLDLTKSRVTVPARDLGAYLRSLESIVVEALNSIDIPARSSLEAQGEKQGDLSLTGVWVRNRKIASLGVAARRWVVFHGAALNLEKDEGAFKGLNPCGYSSNVMTSVEEEIGEKGLRKILQQHLAKAAVERFKFGSCALPEGNQ